MDPQHPQHRPLESRYHVKRSGSGTQGRTELKVETNNCTFYLKSTFFYASFILFYFCLYVADPATFLASNYVLGILFSFESSLFIHLWEYFWHGIFISLTL